MIFGVLNPEKIRHQQLVHLSTSPVYCSVATLPSKIQKKVIYQQYYSYILQIICVILEENKLLLSYPPHLKMSPHYLIEWTNFSSFSFTNANPQPAFSEPPTFGGMQHTFSRMKKCAFDHFE